MPTTIETPPVLTTEIIQPTPFKVVITTPPILVAKIAGGAPQGPAGASGGGFPEVYEYTASADGEQDVTLPVDINQVHTELRINGLGQALGSYSIAGRGAVLPADLLIRVGDRVSIRYYPIN